MNFISSNYSDAIIIDDENETLITYAGELGRILIYQDSNEEYLIVRVATTLGQIISQNNSKAFYVDTVDEFNCVKYAIQVVMELTYPENNTRHFPIKAKDGQGYVTDKDLNILGIVNLSDINNSIIISDTNIDIANDKKPEEKTIRRFFKR